MDYYTKYLKYKQKYSDLKNKLYGGVITERQYLALPDETKALYTYDHSKGPHWDETTYYRLKTPADILKEQEEERKAKDPKRLLKDYEYDKLSSTDKNKYTYDHSEGPQWDETTYYRLKTPADILKEQQIERKTYEISDIA